MTIKYHAQGNLRKLLVKSIAIKCECEPKYLGAPSFAYQIDYFTVDRNGDLIFDDRADTEEIEGMLEYLAVVGFKAEQADETEPEEGGYNYSISFPLDGFNITALDNLHSIVLANKSLLKKALDVPEIEYEIGDTTITFSWFPYTTNAAEIKAYTQLVAGICNLAKKLKRASFKEKKVENEKYAFRCFLLRLGFIGDEYKETRKILLRNLEGNTAFKEKKSEE